MSDLTFFDGNQSWSMDDLAENPAHLRSLLVNHAPPADKTFCPVCGTRAPCDTVSLAATGLAALARLEAAQESERRLRSALVFYANEEHYDKIELYSEPVEARRHGWTHWTSLVEEDEGERARAALASPAPSTAEGCAVTGEPLDTAVADGDEE